LSVVIPRRLARLPAALNGGAGPAQQKAGRSANPLRRPAAWLSTYGGMIREIAFTEFKLKYQGSVLGYVWSFAKPLMLFAILYFVFTHVFKLGSSVPHYGHYLLLGIVLWTYFVDATIVAMVSVVERGDLIRKVYFPRIVIPIAASVSSLITLTLNLAVIFVFIVLGGLGFRSSLPIFLLLLLELFVFSLGCSLLLAALYVRFRDLRHIWDVFLQLFYFMSPILYPLTLLPARVRGLLALSPMAQIVEDSRKILITPSTASVTGVLPAPLWLVPYLLPLALLALGYWYFERTAAQFAEEI